MNASGRSRRDPELAARAAAPLRVVEDGADHGVVTGPSPPAPRPAGRVPTGARAKARPPPKPRRVELDRQALVARGFLDPLGGRTTLGEELRLVKRLLIERAFVSGAPARERIVTVTSALPGEGKTFVAVNLALS